jgi:hypothetical protein
LDKWLQRQGPFLQYVTHFFTVVANLYQQTLLPDLMAPFDAYGANITSHSSSYSDKRPTSNVQTARGPTEEEWRTLDTRFHRVKLPKFSP